MNWVHNFVYICIYTLFIRYRVRCDEGHHTACKLSIQRLYILCSALYRVLSTLDLTCNYVSVSGREQTRPYLQLCVSVRHWTAPTLPATVCKRVRQGTASTLTAIVCQCPAGNSLDLNRNCMPVSGREQPQPAIVCQCPAGNSLVRHWEESTASLTQIFTVHLAVKLYYCIILRKNN